MVNQSFLPKTYFLTLFFLPRPVVPGGRDESKGEKRQQEIEECATALVILKLLSSHLSSRPTHTKSSSFKLVTDTCQTEHILFTGRLITLIVHRVKFGWSKVKTQKTALADSGSDRRTPIGCGYCYGNGNLSLYFCVLSEISLVLFPILLTNKPLR